MLCKEEAEAGGWERGEADAEQGGMHGSGQVAGGGRGDSAAEKGGCQGAAADAEFVSGGWAARLG